MQIFFSEMMPNIFGPQALSVLKFAKNQNYYYLHDTILTAYYKWFICLTALCTHFSRNLLLQEEIRHRRIKMTHLYLFYSKWGRDADFRVLISFDLWVGHSNKNTTAKNLGYFLAKKKAFKNQNACVCISHVFFFRSHLPKNFSKWYKLANINFANFLLRLP